MTEFEQTVYSVLLAAGFIIAPIVFVVLLKISAPYGRHSRAGWGPQMSRRLCWFIMEVPALLVFAYFVLTGPAEKQIAVWIFLALWQIHYLNHAVIYPLRIRSRGARNPAIIALMAIVFNSYNGYLNGCYLGVNGADYDASWLTDPRFLIGIALFAAGFALNVHSDEILFRLRRGDDAGYKIPTGGGYRFVSAPNYLGEVIEWIGWAVMTWSLPGLLFAVWTAANLVPRARTHHRWYREKFPDYPPDRKAVVPFVY